MLTSIPESWPFSLYPSFLLSFLCIFLRWLNKNAEVFFKDENSRSGSTSKAEAIMERDSIITDQSFPVLFNTHTYWNSQKYLCWVFLVQTLSVGKNPRFTHWHKFIEMLLFPRLTEHFRKEYNQIGWNRGSFSFLPTLSQRPFSRTPFRFTVSPFLSLAYYWTSIFLFTMIETRDFDDERSTCI